MALMEPVALIEEAAKKAAVAWLSVPGGGPDYLVWTTWIDGALFLVSGPGEQAAPGLAEAGRVAVSLRGDHGGRIVTWPADVSTVDPAGPEWTEVAPQLAGKRLNASGTTDETVQRWAQANVMSKLTPAGEPESLPDASLAAEPRPTPATRLPKRPFRLHRVRKVK
jgi:hypothetical protein